MSDASTKVEILQCELKIAETLAKEASLSGSGPYGQGFYAGRIDGLRWALAILTGKAES